MRNITMNFTVKVQILDRTRFLTVKTQNYIHNKSLIIEFLFKIT